MFGRAGRKVGFLLLTYALLTTIDFAGRYITVHAHTPQQHAQPTHNTDPSKKAHAHTYHDDQQLHRLQSLEHSLWHIGLDGWLCDLCVLRTPCPAVIYHVSWVVCCVA